MTKYKVSMKKYIPSSKVSKPQPSTVSKFPTTATPDIPTQLPNRHFLPPSGRVSLSNQLTQMLADKYPSGSKNVRDMRENETRESAGREPRHMQRVLFSRPLSWVLLSRGSGFAVFVVARYVLLACPPVCI